MPLVVDASVAFKWFVPEVGSEKALALLELDTDLIAPELLCVEVVNAMWARLRGRDNFRSVVTDAAAALPRMIDTLVPIGTLLPRALEMTIELNHPLYDCLYLALAEMSDDKLLTADQVFAEKCARSRWAERVEPQSYFET
jgi:predicted nucleic acid-binding protein